jgi:hypothetical protein
MALPVSVGMSLKLLKIRSEKMSSVSRKSHKVKEIVCDLAKDLLTAKVGEKIEIQLKDEKMVFERLE